MWLEVNGERMQTGNTRTMIFGVATIVSYLSRFMTLEPGDIITTGTPPGVGMGKSPNRSTSNRVIAFAWGSEAGRAGTGRRGLDAAVG